MTNLVAISRSSPDDNAVQCDRAAAGRTGLIQILTSSLGDRADCLVVVAFGDTSFVGRGAATNRRV